MADLTPSSLAPLPVRIFTLEANGPEAVVAALSVAHASGEPVGARIVLRPILRIF